MTRSALKPWGIFLMVAGTITLAGLAIYAPATPPDTTATPYGDVEAIRAQTAAIREHTRRIYLRNEYWWIGDFLLKGGLLMWLFGLLIEALPARDEPDTDRSTPSEPRS